MDMAHGGKYGYSVSRAFQEQQEYRGLDTIGTTRSTTSSATPGDREGEEAPHEDIISPAPEGLHVRTGTHQVQGQVEQPNQ
jgi:hypothetical protein